MDTTTSSEATGEEDPRPSSDSLYTKTSIGFGLSETTVLGTDGRTKLFYHYGLSHVATVVCAFCLIAFNAAGRPIDAIATWFRKHVHNELTHGSDRESHRCSCVPDSRELMRRTKASLGLDETENYDVPQGARAVIFKEDYARERFGENFPKLEPRPKEVCSICFELLHTKAPSKPICCRKADRVPVT